jgi:hypothetical protein
MLSLERCETRGAAGTAGAEGRTLGSATPYHASRPPQVVSGSSAYFFDPAGLFVPAAAAGGHAAPGPARPGGRGASGPVAAQYSIADADLRSSFADQFAVWGFAEGCDLASGHVAATLLRLPLPQPMAQAVTAGVAAASGAARAPVGAAAGLRAMGLAAGSVAGAVRALRALAAQGPRSLLFLSSLTGLEVSLLRPPLPPPHAPAGLGQPAGPHGPSSAAANTTGAGKVARELLLQVRMPQGPAMRVQGLQHARPTPLPPCTHAAPLGPSSRQPASLSRLPLLPHHSPQATVIPLEPDSRPRPDFTAEGAATRQRPSGPAALGKALGKALVAALGRGGAGGGGAGGGGLGAGGHGGGGGWGGSQGPDGTRMYVLPLVRPAGVGWREQHPLR